MLKCTSNPPMGPSTKQLKSCMLTILIAAQNVSLLLQFGSSEIYNLSGRGMQLSQASQPSQWAAPLVQFILPSVIFSMTIPRRKKIEFDYMFDFRWPKTKYLWWNSFVQLSISLCAFTLILIPVVIDTVIWIAIIIAGAGNMLIAGLYEAHLDYRIVKYIRDMPQIGGRSEEDELRIKRELLVIVVSGNLRLEKEKKGKQKPKKSPIQKITQSITLPGPEPSSTMDGNERGRSRLLNLLGAQSSFGSAVGSPVLFYLGAFVYSILDLRNDPSDEDSAISLGFGIEWMIIVHVAIVSGCLLASNNPSTSASIVGGWHESLEPPKDMRTPTFHTQYHDGEGPEPPSRKWSRKEWVHYVLGWSNSYETEFQPVSLWSRGSNKMRWIRDSEAYQNDPLFGKQMEISWLGWIFKIFISAFLLIVIPPATGGVVAYYTPPTCLGCRSLSFGVYASCQVASTILATIRNAVEHNDSDSRIYRFFTSWSFPAMSSIFWILSLFSAVGGTIMQITGVYRNCLCYTDARDWWNIVMHGMNVTINLAKDTQAQRDSSKYWIWMGSTATIFMGIYCYIGWWYQRLVRKRFTDAVRMMYVPRDIMSARERQDDTDDEMRKSSDGGGDAQPLLSGEDDARRWAKIAEQAIEESAESIHRRDNPFESHGTSSSSQIPLIRINSGDIAEFELQPRVPRPRSNT